MKTKIIIILMILYPALVQSQWGQDVRMTNNSEFSRLSSNNAWCVAASGNNVHIVYYDARTGISEIYYRRSIDFGMNWSNEFKLTNSTVNAGAVAPSIAISGSVLHLVWRDSKDGPNAEIYYKKSIDNGNTWSSDLRLTNNTALSWQPTMAVTGNILHVVWYDNRDGISQVYYKRSADGGTTWGNDIRLSSHNYGETNPSICVSGTNVHVIWYTVESGINNIIYKRSIDGGISWEQDVYFNAGSYPTICVTGTKVYAAWNGINNSIRYRKSIDGGTTWGSETVITNLNLTSSPNPNICVSGSFLHLVWKDNRYNSSNYEIFYKKSRNEGINWEQDIRLTNADGESRNSFISAANSTVHVIWQDERDGNQEVYYKRDTSGNTTGFLKISTKIPTKIRLSQNYPNPFNPTTKINFELPKTTFVILKVYDILGREVERLVDERLNSGTYSYDWNASSYSSGVYFYKLTSEDFTDVKKMVLIK